MAEYDFDEMARHFNAMRVAYLDYRRGGPEPSVQKKLNKYLSLSDLFYRKFPNPFESQDSGFTPSGKELPSRKNLGKLVKKRQEISALREDIESRIRSMESRKDFEHRKKRLDVYLEKCDQKLKVLDREIYAIEVSTVPV